MQRQMKIKKWILKLRFLEWKICKMKEDIVKKKRIITSTEEMCKDESDTRALQHKDESVRRSSARALPEDDNESEVDWGDSE
jgi:hypothetical protein